jgi:rubrerythrin
MKLTMFVAALLAVAAVAIHPAQVSTQSRSISQTTRDHLNTAMHGEAFASAKYLLYADHARAHGHTEIADLFERTGNVERMEHFKEEADLAQLVGDDAANLRDAITGESYEVDTMYREFAEQAYAAGDNAAGARFEEIRRDEMRHRDAFRAALEKLNAKSTGN